MQEYMKGCGRDGRMEVTGRADFPKDLSSSQGGLNWELLNTNLRPRSEN